MLEQFGASAGLMREKETSKCGGWFRRWERKEVEEFLEKGVYA